MCFANNKNGKKKEVKNENIQCIADCFKFIHYAGISGYLFWFSRHFTGTASSW